MIEGDTSERVRTQQVDSMFAKYIDSLPAGRPIVLCTDEMALQHLEDELPLENLDLNNPTDRAKDTAGRDSIW